jgi:hypothetical protein
MKDWDEVGVGVLCGSNADGINVRNSISNSVRTTWKTFRGMVLSFLMGKLIAKIGSGTALFDSGL